MASHVAEITDVYYYTWIDGRDGVLLTFYLISASRVHRITGICHHCWPSDLFFKEYSMHVGDMILTEIQRNRYASMKLWL
jgi:hypothetical protein